MITFIDHSLILETGYDMWNAVNNLPSYECVFLQNYFKIIQFSYFSRAALLMNGITYPTIYLSWKSSQESYLHTCSYSLGKQLLGE